MFFKGNRLPIEHAYRSERSNNTIVARAGYCGGMQATFNPSPAPLRNNEVVVADCLARTDDPVHSECEFHHATREAQPSVTGWFHACVGDCRLVAPVES